MMNNRLKVFFIIFNALVLYIILDYNDESFFNFNMFEFYIKFFIVIVFGILTILTIRNKNKS